MPTPPTVDQLRAAVLHRAVETSYGAVVAELGFPRSNLNKFLHGSDLYTRNLQTLREWYARNFAPEEAPAPMRDAYARVDDSQLDTLRAALRERVATCGRRPTARAVGMSADGLLKFLNGSRPSSITIEKCLRWYTREGDEPPPVPARGRSPDRGPSPRARPLPRMPDDPGPIRVALAAAIKKHGIMRVMAATDVARVTLLKYLTGEPVHPFVLRKLERWADPSPATDLREFWPMSSETQ